MVSISSSSFFCLVYKSAVHLLIIFTFFIVWLELRRKCMADSSCGFFIVYLVTVVSVTFFKSISYLFFFLCYVIKGRKDERRIFLPFMCFALSFWIFRPYFFQNYFVIILVKYHRGVLHEEKRFFWLVPLFAFCCTNIVLLFCKRYM